MVSIEQVQLLEEKVSKAIEYVKRVKEENAALLEEKSVLISKLEKNQKRIDELEVHVLAFKEDQSRIEDGIIAALNRLSQFEEAFENSLKNDKPRKKAATPKELVKEADTEQDAITFEISDKQNETNSAEVQAENSEAESEDAELDIF